jgi:pimeloyl-ACP methyl ester carboxylesterase
MTGSLVANFALGSRDTVPQENCLVRFLPMSNRVILHLLLLVLLTPTALRGQAPVARRNLLVLRGKPQDLYFYPVAVDSGPLRGKILFTPGDGGWRGFAISLAQSMAAWSYEVYGLDTKHYLESFTGKTTLQEAEVMRDFGQIAKWMGRGTGQRVTLVGWSEGAGLCLLGAAAPENKAVFQGLITIGLGESNVLGWRWVDDLTYLTGKDPKEPIFSSSPFLPGVTPLPLLMIQSSQDEYVSVAASQGLYAAAKEPKRYVLAETHNHHFEGNMEQFFKVLYEGLEWVNRLTH